MSQSVICKLVFLSSYKPYDQNKVRDEQKVPMYLLEVGYSGSSYSEFAYG
jgi:hypothetical protein